MIEQVAKAHTSLSETLLDGRQLLFHVSMVNNHNPSLLITIQLSVISRIPTGTILFDAIADSFRGCDLEGLIGPCFGIGANPLSAILVS